MDFIIRPPVKEDAADLHTMRVMEGVTENILALPSERIADTNAWFDDLGPDTHAFVAEIQSADERPRVVGMVTLQVYGGRLRHSGGIGILVHKQYQGKGFGRALLEKLLDLADNYLLLKRLELEVYADNARAIRLYESLGFVQEGVRRCGSIRHGEYADEYCMARIALSPEERRLLENKKNDEDQLGFPGF